jgi:hypothetical protein
MRPVHTAFLDTAAMRVPLVLAAILASGVGCTSTDRDRSIGQSSFESAPPFASGGNTLGDGAGGVPGTGSGGANQPAATRAVEETDLYRLDGNRLYYLNAYRGLMVFDVTNPDQPTLLGRSAIFGSPVDMIVRNGVAIVVVGDWFGQLDDGTPFHGSIVRGLDATDPANIRVLGEAKLGGWVRDDRVVGDVIYAVCQDYGWAYGWGDAAASGGVAIGPGGAPAASVVVSSVSFANRAIQRVDTVRYDGFAGVFNVTPTSILLASAAPNDSSTTLRYLDISDPAGHVRARGSIPVDGTVNGWGTDNGRWNLDFADGVTAHVIGQRYGATGGYTLSTVDFANPDAPHVMSAMAIAQPGWSAAARFDTHRLYLSPQSGWGGASTTPFQVYDLTDPAAPRLAGTIQIAGAVWNILPAPGARLFALGSAASTTGYGSAVSLQYLDVSDPAAPRVLGTSNFGEGWAWTPAAGTFKAFTMDAAKGLVVLPFAGWDPRAAGYNNGLQLIEFTPTTVTTAGPAHTKGWVERGIFVGNRLVSLSNVSLAVVDYANAMAPRVVSELTLARNVITAVPNGATVAEVSSDWWDNDTSTSQVRLLPVANAEDATDSAAVPSVQVDGVGARVFTNGALSYIVTNVKTAAPCPGQANASCVARAQQVQVVDLSSGAPVLRGKLQLPADQWSWYGGGWEGFWWYDWFWGDEVVQVGADVLAFRRWQPVYDASGKYLDANSQLHVVDVSRPDAPSVAAVVVQADPDGWWGNLRVVGETLYTTHYEWVDDPRTHRGWVRYFLDSVDLRDRAHPRIGAKINVPGLIVGGDASDPSLVYAMDYRWEADDRPSNDFDVLRLHDGRATLVSRTRIDGWVGATFVRGAQAYLTAERWIQTAQSSYGKVELHALDLSHPGAVRDRVASENGWGWLLGVEGDRALVTSGWGLQGVDIYRLRDGQAPAFEQTVRTHGWWVNGVSRQANTLFLATGYWGVQKIELPQ